MTVPRSRGPSAARVLGLRFIPYRTVELPDELDMIVVSVADPLYEFPGEMGWKFEEAVLIVVGKFIKSLPKG